MTGLLPTILLLALPASGKSEIRRYLASLDPARLAADFRLGPLLHLDDFPYVHLMRRISEHLRERGHPPVFFGAADQPMMEPGDWGTLTALINADYADLQAPPPAVAAPGEWLLRRLDAARTAVGLPAAFASLLPGPRAELGTAIGPEAQQLLGARSAGVPDSLDERTVVIEFARGGPAGAEPPLPAPHGYRQALSLLSAPILSTAVILYVWVTPEESLRRNRERARPGADGSILHHSVPGPVMEADYGCDDMEWLLEHAERPGTVSVPAHGRVFHVPAVRYDNRADTTSFLRNDASEWPPDSVRLLHDRLRTALRSLAS